MAAYISTYHVFSDRFWIQPEICLWSGNIRNRSSHHSRERRELRFSLKEEKKLFFTVNVAFLTTASGQGLFSYNVEDDSSVIVKFLPLATTKSH